MKDGCSYLGLTSGQVENPTTPTNGTNVENSPPQASFSGFDDTLLSVTDDDGYTLKWISVELGELRAGEYTLTVPLQSVVKGLVVFDGEGAEYAR